MKHAHLKMILLLSIVCFNVATINAQVTVEHCPTPPTPASHLDLATDFPTEHPAWIGLLGTSRDLTNNRLALSNANSIVLSQSILKDILCDINGKNLEVVLFMGVETDNSGATPKRKMIPYIGSARLNGNNYEDIKVYGVIPTESPVYTADVAAHILETNTTTTSSPDEKKK